jgi:pilus assembly protein CpaB
MRQGRVFILIALLLVVGAAALFFVYWFVLRPGAGGGQTTEGPTAIPVTETPVPILYMLGAGQNLERGAIIPTEALIQIPWPTAIVPPTFITDPVKVVGTRARYTIARGEPILSTMIVESLAQLSPYGSDAAAQIPPGYVAISVPYDRRNGVALGIKQGDHVNVIVSWALVQLDKEFQTMAPNLAALVAPPDPSGESGAFSLVGLIDSPIGIVGRGEQGVNIGAQFYVVPSEPQRPRLVSQNFIQDVLVLAVGNFGANKPEVIVPTATPQQQATESGPQPQNQQQQQQKAPTPTPSLPDLITLVVSPQDALALNYVNRMWEMYPGSVQLTLVLRSAGDTSRLETESVTMQYVFDTYNIAVPTKVDYGVYGSVPTLVPTPTWEP